MRILPLALLVLVSTGVVHAATVSLLDGRSIQGAALTFDAKAGTVEINGERVALADCDWVEPGTGSGVVLVGNATKRLGVWLVDGSWLPAVTIAPGSVDHQLAVSGPLGDLTLPLAVVRGWGAGVEAPGTREGEAKGDQVLLDSGMVGGRVEGLVGGKLVLRSDLDPTKPLELPFEQVRGARLALPPRPGKGLRLAVSFDDVPPPLRLMVTDNGLAIAASAPVVLGKELKPARLRIEGGRRVYLSELDPDQVEEAGAFGVVWPFARNANLDGTPLRLGGVRYERGLVVHSKARLAWKLGGAYVRLHTQLGIADLVANQGDCAVAISADGKPLWKRDSVRGGDKPVALELDLTGAQRLELVVDYGARYDIGDHLALADAFLVKAK